MIFSESPVTSKVKIFSAKSKILALKNVAISNILERSSGVAKTLNNINSRRIYGRWVRSWILITGSSLYNYCVIWSTILKLPGKIIISRKVL